MVGDDGIGKTSIIDSYVYDTFSPVYVPSTSNVFKCQIDINHETYINFPKIVLNIQDLSGKPEHTKMRQFAFQKADIIMLCYSTSDQGKSIN